MRIRTVLTAVFAAAALSVGLAAAPAQAANHTDIEIDMGDGYCLDVPNSNFSSGVQVQSWTCNHTGAQKWDIEYVSSYHFRVHSSVRKDLCLNNWASGGARGGDIKLYPCNSSTDSWFNTVGDGWNGYFQFQPKAASTTCVTAWGGSSPGRPMRLDTCSDHGYNSYFDLFNQVRSEQ